MKKDWKAEQVARREQLKNLSKSLKPLIEEKGFLTVNEALVFYYRSKNPDIIEFRTFGDWKKQGATVRKGSKAFVVWAQPRSLRPGEEADTDKPEDLTEEQKDLKETFFPICCLFANTQVITAEEREKHRQAVTAPESGYTHPINQPADALSF